MKTQVVARFRDDVRTQSTGNGSARSMRLASVGLALAGVGEKFSLVLRLAWPITAPALWFAESVGAIRFPKWYERIRPRVEMVVGALNGLMAGGSAFAAQAVGYGGAAVGYSVFGVGVGAAMFASGLNQATGRRAQLAFTDAMEYMFPVYEE